MSADRCPECENPMVNKLDHNYCVICKQKYTRWPPYDKILSSTERARRNIDGLVERLIKSEASHD